MRKFKLVGATVAMVTLAAVVFTQNPKQHMQSQMMKYPMP